MSTTQDAVAPFIDRLRATMPVPVTVGVVLGSGIKALEGLTGGGSCAYGELPGFPTATVAGHAGVMSWGRLGPDGPGVMVARGRFHLYEGHGLGEALAIVELFKALGVRSVCLTNAAGGLRADWRPGDIMLVRDHINLQNIQAGIGGGLRGAEPYDVAWSDQMAAYALAHGVPLHEGTYVGVLGPSYETFAEIKMMAGLGGDAVGMSTVPEVSRAASSGMKVIALSCITNIAITPQGIAETSHQEVVDVAKAASERMEALLAGAVLTAERRS